VFPVGDDFLDEGREELLALNECALAEGGLELFDVGREEPSLQRGVVAWLGLDYLRYCLEAAA
jgi:hypothetical protein